MYKKKHKLKFAFIFILFNLIFVNAKASITCKSLFETNEKSNLIALSLTNPNSLVEIKESSPELYNRIVSHVTVFMNRFKPQQITPLMSEKLFLSIKNLIADTTGKRVENKVSADTAIINKAINNFKNKLAKKGLQLVDRDKQYEGLRNVTYTEYTQPFYVNISQLLKNGFQINDNLKNQPDFPLHVNIRIRSYGTVSKKKKQFGISDITFAKFTEERAFVELKFKDPSYEGAVFKPQMYMNKKYIKMFGTKEFVEKYDEIKNETLAHLKISDKKYLDYSSVEAMLDFIYQAHLAQMNLSVVAINLYERSAKSVTLAYHAEQDAQFDKQLEKPTQVELQMTFDQLISLFVPDSENSPIANQYYKSYGNKQTVAEFKTPTFIAHHLKRAEDAAKAAGKNGLLVSEEHSIELNNLIPGLQEYFELINDIIQERDQTKELNRGKWGNAMKKIKSDVIYFFTKKFSELQEET